MALPIEDYALIGDTHTAALVGRDGSIDWLCLPRFDSGACFAALLGNSRHGRWLLAPEGEIRQTSRRYRENTLILETEFATDDGTVTLVDYMPIRGREPDVVRMVIGRRGQVRMRMELIIRFDYGSIVPWVRGVDHGLTAVAGPDALCLHAPVPLEGKDFTTISEFTVSEGDCLSFLLVWHPSTEPAPPPIDPLEALAGTESWWREWSGACRYQGKWRDEIVRSLITLKALTYAPTGGIVAAPTTSLPELIGGVRNWDYRFCWIRDASFTLNALLLAGYRESATAWREWLLRAAAGRPADMQIMYGAGGERRLLEIELDWLPGYEESSPVRIGNEASGQFQLDVYGELMDTLYRCRLYGIEPDDATWEFQRTLMKFLETAWERPDEGIWEVRGPRRHFTHSKVMAWVAMDRAVKSVERFGLDGPVDHWQKIRTEIHEQVCREGYNPALGSFVQYYGARALDASLLLIPLVGFLPVTDPRVRGTIEAIERTLMVDGFVLRYWSDEKVEGLPTGEGVFLPCTFWFADNLAQLGRREEACALFERLLALRNDVGLLSEEYDPKGRRFLGNFPQAMTHESLINTAYCLSQAGDPFCVDTQRNQ